MVFTLMPDENVRVAMDDSGHGPEIIIGVPGEKAVMIPFVLFAHIVMRVDEIASTNSIIIEEAALVTKH